MKHLLAIFAMLALGSGVALAGSGFGAADANGDGMVTMEEWTAIGITEESAAAVDQNGDGQLDEAEFSALEAQM